MLLNTTDLRSDWPYIDYIQFIGENRVYTIFYNNTFTDYSQISFSTEPLSIDTTLLALKISLDNGILAYEQS